MAIWTEYGNVLAIVLLTQVDPPQLPLINPPSAGTKGMVHYMDHAFCARTGGVYLWVEYCGFQREQEYKEEWSVVHKEDQKF